MTAKTRRQAALLVVLLVVLAAVLYLRLPQAPTEGAPNAVAIAPSGRQPTSDPAAVADLRLEALRAEPEELGPPERNPFRFESRAQPAPAGATPPPRPEPVPPPVPSGPPPPPPIPLKFIGVIDAPARIGTMAVLSDSRGNVFYGKEGDIIEGRYRLLKIGADAAEVAYTDGRGRTTIRLSGQ